MTHSDIYTKFMIEYDKANITSSYPSLTEYEIATILDKAYLALIAQKFTGNNTRNMAFEGDIKAILDLQPLITTTKLNVSEGSASNEIKAKMPSDMLYYVGSNLLTTNEISSIDNKLHNRQNINIVSHSNANNFKASSTNLPWVKQPMGYMQDLYLYILVDPYSSDSDKASNNVEFTYIKIPNMFALDSLSFDFDDTAFELSYSMAEELINLAVIFAAETVESPRLNTKANLRSFES